MKLLDKLKETFFEEEYVEVEEKTKKVKPTPVKEEAPLAEKKVVVKPEIKKEVEKQREIVREEPISEPEKEEKKVNSFSYFDDSDFVDEEELKSMKNIVDRVDVKKEEPKKIYDNPVYGSKKIQSTTSSPYPKEAKLAFKPTPIISPIYGVLDKNYKKEEIVDKKEVKPTSSYVSRKNVDLDSIREKAFGTNLQNEFNLTDEVKETVEVKDDLEVDDNLLYDMTEIDKTPSVDKVTLQDAEEYFQDLGLEYNVDYKDAKYEKVTGRRVNKTPKIDEFDEDEVTLPIKEAVEVPKQEEKEDISLEDNLFDLIDSMYEEKE